MTVRTDIRPIVQVKALPAGTPEYEEKRSTLLKTFWEKVPSEYLLPQSTIGNPPLNVTGIPKSSGTLTPEDLEITETHDATSLASAIASRKYTAVAVAKAFAKRAIIAHQLVCCLTQWFMDDAIKQAEELDEHLAKTGKTVGPFHGVPISIKDHIPIANTYSSQGTFGSIVKDEEDCDMIAILRNLGAVFYCKTNQPQAIMHLESTSHWGRVLNPFNINLSAGGSTGGEAALIAMKGSVLGVGTDIGGSVRGPSAFCGIWGFKPTSYTLPMNGFLATDFPAELNVLCSTGPMGRSLRDMDLFVNSILSTKPHLKDPRLIPIPWTGLQTSVRKPIRIGIIENDGFIEPQPPVKRAISWARSLLSDPKYKDLFEIKPFTPFGAKEAWYKIRRMYWPDGGQGLRESLASTGEPIHPLSEWITKDAAKAGTLTGSAVSAQRRERDNFRIDFAKHWEEQGVDVAIGPAFVGPACAHDTALYWTYTSLYNFVDYPGLVFPTPIAAEAKESYAADYKPLSEECSHVKKLWEETNFEGAPIDLQINARKYHDNELFGVLEILKEALSLQ